MDRKAHDGVHDRLAGGVDRYVGGQIREERRQGFSPLFSHQH